MKLKITRTLFILVLFVPFEVLILKYLPVSDTIYGYLRFAVEVIIYLLAGLLLVRYAGQKKLPEGTPIDKPLEIFIGYALLITAMNQAPLIQSFLGLRVLLRYVPLFYIMALIQLDRKFVKATFYSLMFTGVIQGCITAYQHYFGIAGFWYPRASDLEIAGKQVTYKLIATGFGSGREMGAGIGTFGDSVPLALFMVIVFVVAMAAVQKRSGLKKRIRMNLFIVLGLMLLTIFYTYSRGSVLLAIASLPIIFYFTGGRKIVIAGSMVALLLISPVILTGFLGNGQGDGSYINPKQQYTDPISNITSVFTTGYLENTLQYSRGMVLTEIGGQLLMSVKLFGYGPAQDYALEKAAQEIFGSNIPINNLPIINDVYWVAFLVYYGIIGLIIYLFILYKIMRASVLVYKYTPDEYMKIFGLAMAAIVLISIPYSFILRTFLFRSFGFYFWLLGGIVVSEYRRLKIEGVLPAKYYL